MRRQFRKGTACMLTVIMLLSPLAAGISAGAAGAGVKLNKTSVTLKEKKTVTLKVRKKNVSAVKSIRWASSNKKIAAVSRDGVVKGIKAGKAIITCRVRFQAMGKRKYMTRTLKATVRVKAAKPQAPEAPAEAPTVAPTAAPTVAPTAAPTVAPTQAPETNQAEEIAKKLGAGVNLGNNLDAFNDTSGYMEGKRGLQLETGWGAGKITKAYIDAIKTAGFRTVRIPVSYVNHVKTETDASGNKKYTIDPDWLARVKEVTDWALEDDLYVILNIHHDGGDSSNGDTLKSVNGEQVCWLSPLNHSDAAYAQMEEKFVSLWTQIANQFKNHSEKLLFADMNEFHHGYGTPKKAWTDTQNKLHQKFVDIVRATGGKNTGRYLIIPGYNTDITHTISSLRLPTDIAQNQVTYKGTTNGHIIVEVHYYDPYTYAGDDASENVWGDGSGNASTWGNEEHLKKQMKRMRDAYTSKGIPVIIGEYGAAVHKGIDAATDLKYRTYYYSCVVREAVSNGMVPIAWDNGTGFTLVGRDAAVPYPEIINAIMKYCKEPTVPAKK